MLSIENIKKQLMETHQLEQIKDTDYLSTGSTLLDLACSDNIKGGFIKGKYYFLVGDSASGKTFLSLTCLAEASINTNFDNYRFIYDNSEGGALMNIEKFFGAKVAKRLEPPSVDKNNMPLYSSSIEEVYYNVDDALQEDKPFIYILDSMDSLTSDAEIEKFEETKAAFEKGKQVAGSYGDGKAKKNSANLRRLMGPLRETGSILIILNQTRDNIGFGFEKKARSGGHSLRFYACLEMWSSVKGKITKTYKEKKRQIGIKCSIKLKKNRLTGKERSIEIPIYYSYGFDDIGSCVDYLVEEKVWPYKKPSIVVDDFGVKLSRDKLIAYIEENELENDLKMIVAETWKSVEDACALKRKKRY
jgi:RecA/RadA recombinase